MLNITLWRRVPNGKGPGCYPGVSQGTWGFKSLRLRQGSMTKAEETSQDLKLIARIKNADVEWAATLDSSPWYTARLKGINVSVQVNANMATVKLNRGERTEFVCRHVMTDDLVCRAIVGLKNHCKERVEKAQERILVNELLADEMVVPTPVVAVKSNFVPNEPGYDRQD